MTNKEKLFFYVYAALIVIILSAGFDFAKGIIFKSVSAAPVEYVDDKFKESKEYTDKENNKQNFDNSNAHNILKVEIDKKASNEKVDAMLVSLKRVIEQNDKLYLFLLEQKGK